MQQRPQRPFVPHRTPKASRHAATQSEFRLSRPFVPGSLREEVEAAPVNTSAEVATPHHGSREQLPPIEAFLDNEESDELPPIEHFLDPLPAVGSFAPDADGALIDEAAVATAHPATGTGWVVDDWQQYDWRAAAALGDGVDAEASNEWATTDWGVGAPAARDNRPSAAHAIANALDQIAQRIREGELTVPPPGGLTDPAAIAAALAALLGVRR